MPLLGSVRLALLLGLLSVLSLIAFSSADDFTLLLLHNNDMHARFEETSRASGTCKPRGSKSCVGGFARTIHVVREARLNATQGIGPKVLYLNAGDTYTGTAWYGVHKWKIVADFLNLLKPDAMSFGNHEFDSGVKGLVPLIDRVKFPIVVANLNYSKEPELAEKNIPKSVVIDVDGHKVGVIGYLTPETIQISQPEGVIFLDEVPSIKEESELLVGKGVNIIIALGHSGYETDKKIAKECPEVDVVIGGHTNTFLWNGSPPDAEKPEGLYPTVIVQPSGKKVPVVQAYAYTKYMGFLKTTFNENGDLIKFVGDPWLLNNTIPEDQDVLDLLETYRPEIDALDKQVVGKSKVLLDGSAEECRFRECNLGNLIADAFVAYRMSVYGGLYWTDTPIGWINGGAIRNSIDAAHFGGNITRGELLGMMPFDNQIYTISLNGSDILDTLELGVRSNGETSRGEFLQVSGMKVQYDLAEPVGHRVVKVTVRCAQCNIPHYEPLEVNRTYRIITTSFLMGGGDGHHVLQTKSFRKKAEDLNDIDMVAWYFGKFSPVRPEIEERIRYTDKSLVQMEEKNAAASTVKTMLAILPASVVLLYF